MAAFALYIAAARDLLEAIAEDRRRGGTGARGAALGSLSLLGGGVSTYNRHRPGVGKTLTRAALLQKARELNLPPAEVGREAVKQ